MVSTLGFISHQTPDSSDDFQHSNGQWLWNLNFRIFEHYFSFFFVSHLRRVFQSVFPVHTSIDGFWHLKIRIDLLESYLLNNTMIL